MCHAAGPLPHWGNGARDTWRGLQLGPGAMCWGMTLHMLVASGLRFKASQANNDKQHRKVFKLNLNEEKQGRKDDF